MYQLERIIQVLQTEEIQVVYQNNFLTSEPIKIFKKSKRTLYSIKCNFEIKAVFESTSQQIKMIRLRKWMVLAWCYAVLEVQSVQLNAAAPTGSDHTIKMQSKHVIIDVIHSTIRIYMLSAL